MECATPAARTSEDKKHLARAHYALEAGEDVAGGGVEHVLDVADDVERVERRAERGLVRGGGADADDAEVLEDDAELAPLDVGLVDPGLARQSPLSLSAEQRPPAEAPRKAGEAQTGAK